MDLGERIGNELYLANVDNEHYVVEVSTPPYEGILGDLAVEVREFCRAIHCNNIDCDLKYLRS